MEWITTIDGERVPVVHWGEVPRTIEIGEYDLSGLPMGTYELQGIYRNVSGAKRAMDKGVVEYDFVVAYAGPGDAVFSVYRRTPSAPP